MRNKQRPNVLSRRQQFGIVLITSMVLLFAMTLLGVTVIRDAKINTQIIGNSQDVLKTTEAAELSTRSAENWIQSTLILPPIVQDNFIDSSDNLNDRKVMQHSLFDVTDTSAWNTNGRLDPDLTLSQFNALTPPKFVVTFLSKNDEGSTTKDPWDSFQKNSLNVGLDSDVSGRFIFKVYGQAQGATTKSTATIETTYAIPFK